MRFLWCLIVGCLIACLPACLPSVAQIIRTETQLVAVDVVVTDKKGNYVRGLTFKDFHVWEDNKEQTLKSFSFEEETAQAPDQKRFIVLFFDAVTMSVGDMARAQQAATRFAEAGVDTPRMLAVASSNGSLRIVQNFTDDLNRVKRALANGLSSNSQFDSVTASVNKSVAENAARDTFSALKNLARGLGPVQGRKAIVFFTSAYPASAQHSTELAEAIDASNKSNVAIFPIDVQAGGRTAAMTDASDSPAAATGRLGAIGGRGGAGQPRGTAAASPSDALADNPAAMRQFMDMLAEGTGGFILHGSNDPFAGLAKIQQEQSVYYMLGYTPPESPDGSCHKLRVKVDRDGTTVRARTQYCKAKPQQVLAGKPIERELEGRASGAQSGNIEASMQLPFFYTSANEARVNVAMEITPSALKFEKQKDKLHGSIDILGLAYLLDGSVGARFSDTLKLDFDDQKQIDQLKQKPLHYENQFPIASGQYVMKVVFSSGGESFGKVEQALTVEPYTKSQFSLSALTLSKEVHPASDLNLDLTALLGDDRTPLIASGMRVIPYGSSRFKKTDPAVFYVEIYQPSLDEPSLQIRILDRKTGAQKLDSGQMKGDAPKAPGMIPYALKMPIADLAPGSYVLEVQTVDPSGKTIKRTSDFEIE